jgi:hypothetical protein
LFGLGAFRLFKLVHRTGADRAGDFGRVIHHREQDNHAIIFEALENTVCKRHRRLPALGLALRHDRVEFSDLAQAFGLGGMWARNKGSADLGAVPAGLDAEAERFCDLNVTVQEVLHEDAFG